MASELTDLLVAGYQTVGAANKDFDALIEGVKAKHVQFEAAILVAHDADGNVTVHRTGDDLGRTGTKWGGGVGFLVGLAAPPLLASVVVGAAAGRVLGKPADHKVEQGLHDKLGEAMKPGTAAIIAMFDVIGAPVAKAAVVTAAVRPGPSPVAKAAVVGAAVSPGPSPIAKAAVVGAAVTPGRRRF